MKSNYKVYPTLLEEAGYHVGFTGKGWGPGNPADGGWGKRNPAGPACNAKTLEPPASGIARTDYAASFEEFLNRRPGGSPFCFWFGCNEPHRPYPQERNTKSERQTEDVRVPSWLPDVPVV